MSILKGTIYITDNLDIVYNAPLNTTKIVNLDEDGILQDNEAFLGGTCLLPPMEAKIAEIDGNEYQYNMFYQSHLLEPYQQQFIAALISYLYVGGNLILFLPETDYDNTKKQLIYHMWTLYGIHIGIIGSTNPNDAACFYDERCEVIWINMIYTSKVITAREFLYVYPLDAVINNQQVVAQLIEELQPIGNSINEKMKTIDHYRELLKKNPQVNMVLIQKV